MLKNVAGQKWRVFAFNRTTNAPHLAGAANITAKLSKDWAAAAALADVNPVETEDGYYLFDIAQTESNADNLDLYPECSTADIQVIGTPASQHTTVDLTNVALVDDINTALGVINDFLSPEIADIKAKTDLIPAAPASETTLAAVKVKTDLITTAPATEVTALAIKAKTDLISADPATATAVAAIEALLNNEVALILGRTNLIPDNPATQETLVQVFELLDNEIVLIKAKTDLIPAAAIAEQATLVVISKLLHADKFIDTTTNPWSLVYLENGTAVELLRQPLRSIAGAAILSTDVVIGQAGI